MHSKPLLRRLLKIALYFLGIVFFLLLTGILLLNVESFQNWLAKKGTHYLSDKLKTRVEIQHISIDFFNRVHLQGVYLEDQQQDTLAFIGDLKVKTSELIRNYWSDSEPVFHYIGLERAHIRLHRAKDSIWNYQWMETVLGGSNSPTDTTLAASEIPINPKNENNTWVQIKQLHLKDVKFEMVDGWRGEDLVFAVSSLQLVPERISPNQKHIELDQLKIQGADILVREYEGNKPEDNEPDDTTDWGTPFNPDNYFLALQELQLRDCHFRYLNADLPPSEGVFDEDQLDIQQIHADIFNTRIHADTLFASIRNLQASERSGLAVKSMQADLKLSQVQAILSHLYLKTAHSEVRDYFEMRYRNFHDFNDFIDRVMMKATLDDARISSLDIGYFAEILNEYPIAVQASGNLEGTVRHLKGNSLQLHTRQTSFEGDVQVEGLPDVENAYFTANNINIKTSGKDLNALIPQTRHDAIAWQKLDRIEYRGSYQGKTNLFATKGMLQTSMGNALVDIQMDFSADQPGYKGQLETNAFQLGTLLHQNNLGKITMKGHIDGEGFNLENLNTRIDATIQEIGYENSVYRNITVDGLVARKKFDGIFISRDSGLSINFNGKLDLSGQSPSYQFTSRFIRFDLQKFGVSDEPLIGSGYATLNFSGSNLDNFVGVAMLKDLILEKNGHILKLNDFHLQSEQSSVDKTLRLHSQVADAEVRGQFNLSELPAAIQLYLHYYLPQYIKLPQLVSQQRLTYQLQLKQVDTLLAQFIPDLNGLSASVISGELDTKNQKFSLDANIPVIGYQQAKLKDLYIVGAGDYSAFNLDLNAGNLFYDKELIIPSMQMSAVMSADTGSLNLTTQSINELLGDAQINVRGYARENKLYLNLLPSNITIKDDKWQLSSQGDLVFGNTISVDNLIIESGAQQITANTLNNESNDLELSLQELDLHSLGSYLNLEQELHGRLNGLITVHHPTKHPLIEANVYTTNAIRLDHDTLGQIFLVGKYDQLTEQIQLSPETRLVRNSDIAQLDGKIYLKDSTIYLNLEFKEAPLQVINRFIHDYVRNLTGTANGKLVLDGRINHPGVSGKLLMNQIGFDVLYLGTRYSSNAITLQFSSNTIDIPAFDLYDERGTNYSASVYGRIKHKEFKNMVFDIKSSSKNFLCLKTMEWDNDLYYGTVTADVEAQAIGPLNDLVLNINAKPLKGSTFYLPINSSGDASTYDYISFSSLGQQQQETTAGKSVNYFKINLNIAATPDAEVFIILDQNTREEIVARGNGDINMKIDLGNSIEMFGTYTITDGRYEFNFRGVLPRTFLIDDGSKIVWNGDPLAANLDVAATYRLPNPLPLYPLIQGLTEDETEIAEARKKYETLIHLNLKDQLSSPEIKFDIQQPNNRAISSLAYEKLNQIRNDEREMVSQAGVLLLLGEFKGSDGISTGSYERGGVATASDLISNALSSGLTNVFSSLTGLNNVSLNLGYKQFALNDNQSNRNQFNLNVSANLFKERVVVDFGSNLDVDRNNQTAKGNTSTNLGGDFKAQYLVTEDGRLRVNAYRTTSNINVEGNNVMKGGVGVTYKKVFNSLADFFSPRRKRNKSKSEETRN